MEKKTPAKGNINQKETEKDQKSNPLEIKN